MGKSTWFLTQNQAAVYPGKNDLLSSVPVNYADSNVDKRDRYANLPAF